MNLIQRVVRPIGTLRSHSRAAGFVGAVLVLAALSGCGDSRESRQASTTVDPGRQPDQRISDFALTETEGGRKLWVLRAEQAKVFDSSNEVNLDTLVVDFYDEEQAHVSTLTSDHGVIERATRDMQAFGQVRIRTDEGLRLEADEVRWVQKEGRILSDSRVRFTRGENVLTGVGFESDPSLKDIEIRRAVEAEVRDTDGLKQGETPEP
jgi:LPS export ABC transporter protein LptC